MHTRMKHKRAKSYTCSHSGVIMNNTEKVRPNYCCEKMCFMNYIPHRKQYLSSRISVPDHLYIISLFFILSLTNSLVSSQTIMRPFPRLYNAARNRPIVTNPSDSTCGIPLRNAYCKSSVIEESIKQCVQDFCVHECPYRNALPSHNNLLSAISPGQGQCVVTDSKNTKPGSVGASSTSILNGGANCYLTPVKTPLIGTSGAFTLAVWMWQSDNNVGTLLQKLSSTTKEIIMELTVQKEKLTFSYRGTSGVVTVTLEETIPPRTWIHIAIQVYMTTLSFYLNGPGPGYTAAKTVTLVSNIQDGQGEARIGQTISGGGQFLGRLQDFLFFNNTLSNREISEVLTGKTIPFIRAQTECRCPPSHPRIKPDWEHYCLNNGVPDTNADDISRLNSKTHILEYANDGDSGTRWISKFQNKVNLTVNLGDVYQVFYVKLQFYSPMPKAVVIERQRNASTSWEVWQMYAEDCSPYFGQPNNGPLLKPTSVNCIQFGKTLDAVPYSKGNITFTLLASEPVERPGYNDFYNTPALHGFVEATNIRVQFHDHYYVTTLRHEYYGLSEFIVTGRCDCSGHAFDCDTKVLPYKCNCTTDSHTMGDKCDKCQPLFNNKPFRRGNQVDAFDCRPCECFGHADSCQYNVTLDPFPNDHVLGGGGVCQNCKDNTAGRFCDFCIPLYYRPTGKSKFDKNVCTQCLCDATGVAGNDLDCAKEGGQCKCKANVDGRQCEKCTAGFYNLQAINPKGCDSCDCHTAGTVNANISCHPTTGDCYCKANVRNAKCDTCDYGYFNLDAKNDVGCSECECNPRGSTSKFCNNVSGQCSCKTLTSGVKHITGRKCDECAPGYYDFNNGCKPCDCDTTGTIANTVCNATSGQCVCKPNVEGIKCNKCTKGSFGFGSSTLLGCQNCQCNLAGTIGSSMVCDAVTGKCECKANVEGVNCNQCKGNTFGLNISVAEGCSPCNCDVSGTDNLACDHNTGQCTCLSNRIGRRCDDCSKGYYYNPKPKAGCNNCGCSAKGTVPQTYCNSKTGQCQCLGDFSGVIGRACSECAERFFNFDPETGSCTFCDCSRAGTVNMTQTCEKNSGQCLCKDFTTGRRCDTCVPGASYLDQNNPYGCSKAPGQQPPPTHDVINSTALMLKWMQPDYPNGVISSYKLYRNGTLIFTGDQNSMTYLDDALEAYTQYSYVIDATNDYGSVKSPAVVFRTNPGAPTGMVIVYVTNISSRNASFSWNQPVNMNGPLKSYSVMAATPSHPDNKLLWKGTAKKVTITSLIPFTNYNITVETCTPGGCLDSWTATFNTKSDMPGGMKNPVITVESETSLLVKWNPPTEANGLIIFYELWLRGVLQSDNVTRDPKPNLIFHPGGQYNPRPTLTPQENALPPPDTSYVVKGLDPFTEYEFQVLAENSIGKTASRWVSARTGESTPLSTPTPTLSALSSTELKVSWDGPSDLQSRGVIKVYFLYFLRDNNVSADPFAPPSQWILLSNSSEDSRSHVVGTLMPYSNYSFIVGACNSVGCVNSSIGYGRTAQAAPEGLKKPVIYSLNSTVIKVDWNHPEFQNGPPPVYTVRKTTPALTYPSQVVEGTRFPGGGYYKFPPETVPTNVGFTGIRFWFRTSQRNGLLMFAASAGRQEEFMALQFKDGRPWFLFDPQGCLSYIEIDPKTDEDRIYSDNKWHYLRAVRDNEYSDISIDSRYRGCASFVTTTNDEGLPFSNSEWHYIVARRVDKVASLSIDVYWAGVRENKCATGTIIGKSTAVYIGGLPIDFVIRRKDTDSRVEIVKQGFQGCIRNIEFLHQVYPTEVWKPLDWSTAASNDLAYFNWQGCPTNLDKGYHFQGQGYAIVPHGLWTIGAKQQLMFHFRTAMHTGLMFFSHGGPGIYAFIAIINGALYFEFSNGIATGSVTFKKPSVNFCDGNWYSVLVLKENQQGLIDVSGHGVAMQGNSSIPMIVSLAMDLYIGGVPEKSLGWDFIKRHKVNVPSQAFGGCIYNIRTGTFLPVYYLTYVEVVKILKVAENVNLDGCTPMHLPDETCRDDVIETIYNGTETAFLDENLHPYSDYLYQVIATNDAGHDSSSWNYGQTKEGAPIGVRPPHDVKVLSGYIIFARWYRPLITAGLLTKYILRAYSLDNPSLPPVEEVITDIDIGYGQIKNAIPHTKYLVKLGACTGGGCSESPTGVTVNTKEEAPAKIAAPTAVAGTTYLTIKWKVPGMPNGNITGYFLYQDGRQIYSGGLLTYNLTGLQVYTAYKMHVKACTQVGCTDGDVAYLSTAQLPPSYMEAPTLRALGTTKVEARWKKPDQMNGVLQRYLLYVSEDADELGSVVYNSSTTFDYYVIPDLVAGKTYHIVVSACTLGGCALSNASTVVTEESAPDGVPNPVITSPTFSELSVTWGVPKLPNGFIVRYELYHNEVKEYSGLARSYLVTGLAPYSLHTIRIAACTSRGCGSSLLVEGRTLEAEPVGFVVMEAKVEGQRSISVKWTPPNKPNGILYYDIYAEGLYYADKETWNYTVVKNRQSLKRTTNHSEWMTIGQLIPMSSYDVQVNASNSAGFILSNVRTLELPQGSPDGVKPPTLVSETSTNVTASWIPVGRKNAQESPQYILQFRDLGKSDIVEDIFGPTTTFIYKKSGLFAYTKYEFRLKAFNSHGHTLSDWVTITTKQDKPQGIDPPLLPSIGARYIDLTWQPPFKANGIMKHFKIYQNQKYRITVFGNDTGYRAIDLDPFTLYKFAVEGCTEGGCTKSSESVAARTLEDVSEGVEIPELKSLTPTSVEVKWKTPSSPNGLIKEYQIERLQSGSDNPVLVDTVLPSSNKVLVDDAADISPFTTYKYRVKVINGAGASSSPWATITTMSARPTGMLPPSVKVEGPKAMVVTWQSPLKPNGRIESYVVRLPDPRREIRNTSVLKVTFDDLSPYHDYSVTVTACTDGGCTESPPVKVQTTPTIPEGQSPPIPHPVSQNLISVAWQGPAKANGPNIRFELSRQKIRQPLDSDAVGFDMWESVYTGTSTYYEDRGLPLFTTFKYRITVYNDVGQQTSGVSREVTTHGGFPRRAANVTVTPVDHLTLRVDWEIPTVVELQGSVEEFTLFTQSKMRNNTEKYPPGTNSAVIKNLTPNTDYTIYLTIRIHGNAKITSEPVTQRTLDGAPEGLAKPVLAVLNQTAVRVAWTAPVEANGQITGYFIYVNNKRIQTNRILAGSYVVSGLMPYTVYSVKIQVCTVFDCTSSEAVLVTTAEALPQQLTKPVVSPVSPTTMKVEWTKPIRPNGIILRYDLSRRSIKQCSEIPPSTLSPEVTKCTYIQCGILENLCGSTCYSGPKICCEGVLHDNRLGYDCCGKSYSAKDKSDDVCCGGTFYRRLEGYACCKDRYIKVGAGETCCVDPYEDRVTVGLGDKCCASVPYSSTGSQICCKGKLYDGFEKQCCGGEIISSKMVCCGNKDAGSAYSKASSSMECCGTRLVESNTTLCCTSDTGHSKVHRYSSAEEKLAANVKCCGLEAISSILSCCNYIGYNPLTHVCSDKSNQAAGCGSGSLCLISSSKTAFCDQCNFDKEKYMCGSLAGYHSKAPTTPKPDPASDCTESEERIYTGQDLTFTDDKLSPFSKYSYGFTAVNKAGGSQSEFTQSTTLEAPPHKVDPPLVTIDSKQLYVMDLSWKFPEKPNGMITRFILTRDGIELYRGLGQQYTDDSTILPYRSYTYILTACTAAGCTSSNKVTVATAEGKPESILPPVVDKITSKSFQVKWSPPAKPNGIISDYRLYIKTVDGKVSQRNTTSLSLSITGLQAYTQYELELEVCTKGGCTKSSKVTIITLEDLPEGVLSPKVIVLTAKTTLVFWNKPDHPNGVIKFYSIMRRWATGAVYVYFGSDQMATDDKLTPGETYSYYLIVGNSVGNMSSQPTSVTMPGSALVSVAPPKNVTVLDATSIYIAWDAVVVSGSDAVDQYRVLLNAGRDSEVDKGVGLQLSTTVRNLKPNSKYEVRVQACLKGVPNGCGTGTAVTVTTFEAPPQNLAPPILKAIASNIVDIFWTAPKDPNGVITQYLVYYKKLGGTVDLLINRVQGDVFEIRHAGQDLKPYTTYQYKVNAGNSKGVVSSEWSTVRTLEMPPDSLLRPHINSTSAYNFFVSWSPPINPNGIITRYTVNYRVLTNDPTVQTPLQSVTVSPNTLGTSVSNLDPFSNYHVKIMAFNTAGNTSSGWTLAQTAQSSPSGLKPFSVEKIDTGTSVILRWDVPAKPNGVISTYNIYEDNSLIALYKGLNREFEFRRLKSFSTYTVWLEACTTAGCTKGGKQSFTTAETPPTDIVAPTFGEQNSTAVTVIWTKPVSPNGKITLYEVLRRTSTLKRSLSEPQVVHQLTATDSDVFRYTDTNLEPYKEYQYSIRASNSKGFVQGPWNSVFTAQAAPEGVLPPQITHISDSVSSLNIKWSPPSKPNGIIQNYKLQRNNTVPLSFATTDKMEYIDNGLVAYTWYTYTITVCTAGGCTKSDPRTFRTKETSPLQVSPPSVNTVNSTALRLSWKQPLTTNGKITLYELKMSSAVIYSGMNLVHIQSGLKPYTEYKFVLKACTSGGCTESGEVGGRPDDDTPSGLSAPVLKVLSSSSVEINWSPPVSPNGIISSYDLRRDGKLIYTESISTAGSLRTSYVDYGLSPGTEYSYIVIARNRKGSVESAASKATTYSSSPSGLDPPSLQALSSTTVQASWKAPAKPNGVIKNYTLFESSKTVFSAGPEIMTYVIPGLKFWTEYTFRVQACTSRGCELSGVATVKTLEAPPEDLKVPKLLPLGDQAGAHNGVLVTWEPPVRPNGRILSYDLSRRQLIQEPTGISYGDVKTIFSGPQLRYTDQPSDLQPFTDYQYMVTATSSVGKTSSDWQVTTTKEGAPEGVLPPTVKSTTATSITVTLTSPVKANGNIQVYSVLVNGSVGSSSKSLEQTVGLNTALRPFAVYSLQMRVCTGGGCTVSSSVTAKTGSAKPAGLAAIKVVDSNSTAVKLKWAYPTSPNGEILRFVIYQRSACPPPSQPFLQSCVVGETTTIFDGLAIEKTVTSLLPYSSYEFQIQAENKAGFMDTPSWVKGQTLQADPQYIRFPQMFMNVSAAVFDWTLSFVLHGKLREFILIADGRVTFRGVSFIHQIDNIDTTKTIELTIAAVTEKGQVESPLIVFDPNTIDNIGSTPAPTSTSSPVVQEKQFYQEIWFIVLLILVTVLFLFIIMALCLRQISARRPYIRERAPLKSRHRKGSQPFTISSDESGFDTEMSGRPFHHKTPGHPVYGNRHGVSNPVFSHRVRHPDSFESSSTPSLEDEDMLDDDDIDYLWKKKHEAGLFDDVESTGLPAYSITKEQTVFTDTHL